MQLQQGQQHYCNEGKDALTAKMPVHQHWLDHCNEGDNASLMTALIMATTPLLQGQQLQLDDYASSTMAEMPSRQGQQSPSRQPQRHLHINGNNTIMRRATMPS
jgi:hypothetical protein